MESVLDAGGLRLVGGQHRYTPSPLHGVRSEWSTRDPVHHRGVGSRRRGPQVGGRAAAVHAFFSPRCTAGVVYKRPGTSWSRFSAQGGSGWWAGSSGTRLLLSTVYCRSGLQETQYVVESVGVYYYYSVRRSHLDILRPPVGILVLVLVDVFFPIFFKWFFTLAKTIF